MCSYSPLSPLQHLGSALNNQLSRRSPGGGHGNPLQYSRLQNPMDRGAWQTAVYKVTKCWTWLSDLTHIYTYAKLNEHATNCKQFHFPESQQYTEDIWIDVIKHIQQTDHEIIMKYGLYHSDSYKEFGAIELLAKKKWRI